MKLTKIKHKDGELTLQWLEEGGDRPTLHKHELASKEAGEPEFHQALIAVRPHVLDLLELPGTCAAPDSFLVQGASFSYDKDGPMGDAVTCLRELRNADAPLVLNTPRLQGPDVDDDGACLTESVTTAINDVLLRAEDFINGAGAQRRPIRRCVNR